jgi:hypothetical protein
MSSIGVFHVVFHNSGTALPQTNLHIILPLLLINPITLDRNGMIQSAELLDSVLHELATIAPIEPLSILVNMALNISGVP